VLNLAGFRALFPEFAKANDALVQSRLDQAAKRLDVAVWGIRIDEGHGLLTAHLLALSPFGQAARLVSDKGQTTYGKQYQDILPEIVGLTSRVF